MNTSELVDAIVAKTAETKKALCYIIGKLRLLNYI